MRAGVRIAREAVSRAGRGYVAADMGPSGRLLAPYGDLLFENAIRLFQDGFAAAIEEGPDLLLIETMTDLAEVKACVLGAKQALKAAADSCRCLSASPLTSGAGCLPEPTSPERWPCWRGWA